MNTLLRQTNELFLIKFSSTDRDSFEVKYKIYIDDKVVEEREPFVCTDWEGEPKRFKKIELQDVHEVKANAQLEICITCAASISGCQG
jgi:hypothetical protein